MSSKNQKRLSQNVYPQAALRFLHCILANVILVRIMFYDKEQIKITIPNNSNKKYVKMQNTFKEICLNIKLFHDIKVEYFRKKNFCILMRLQKQQHCVNYARVWVFFNRIFPYKRNKRSEKALILA